MTHSFFGGVNPATHKESTRRKPIARLEQAPQQVILPLQMSSYGCATPLVRAGDTVLLGQPIATGEGLGAVIHASVSGRVAAIEPRPHPWGGEELAIVLDNDGHDTPWPNSPEKITPDKVDLALLLERVTAAGIVGMGGGAFPTAEKLRAAAGKADTLIVNAAECEPYITADHRLLLERSDQILICSRLLARALDIPRAVVATQGDKLNAAEIVERRLVKHSGKVELRTVRTRYPLGAEKQIVQAVTGREIPTSGNALDVNCLVLNVATVYAIQDALMQGKALTHRTVTVTGGAVSRPRNLWVPIGTPLRCLVECAGGLRETPELMLTGGPMTGTPLHSLDAPVLKSTNALVCLSDFEQRKNQQETTCIRCGKCVSCCPMHLTPIFISQAMRQQQVHKLPRLHPQDCIQCGCCSYICPAHIPLVELVCQAGDCLEDGGAV